MNDLKAANKPSAGPYRNPEPKGTEKKRAPLWEKTRKLLVLAKSPFVVGFGATALTAAITAAALTAAVNKGEDLIRNDCTYISKRLHVPSRISGHGLGASCWIQLQGHWCDADHWREWGCCLRPGPNQSCSPLNAHHAEVDQVKRYLHSGTCANEE